MLIKGVSSLEACPAFCMMPVARLRREHLRIHLLRNSGE
jgi:hypothetical protein